jgi:predicted RNA methylase
MVRDDEIFVGLSDIADFADVTRAAVSNWRKRHADFPPPRVRAAGGDLFSLDEVEAWLIENGKISSRVPPSAVLWRLADGLRSVWEPQQIAAFLLGALVYVVACQRTQKPAEYRVVVPREASWFGVSGGDDKGLHKRLVQAARLIEEANQRLAGLLIPGIGQQPSPNPGLLRRVLDALRASVVSAELGEGEEEVLNEIMHRHHGLDPSAARHVTPDDVAYLMVRLAEPIGETVWDPAVGRGGMLLLAGLHAGADSHKRRLIGFDTDQNAVRWARSWFFIYDTPAELRVANSLLTSPDELPAADTVLLDPPYGLAKWGDAERYLDTRWRFGAPSPKSADYAWLQLAADVLTPRGRAVVALPAAALWQGGREQQIRQALVDANAVEAVVQLPAGLRRDTAIPLAIWVLRPPAPGRKELLLLDGSNLGASTRTVHTLEPDEIESIAELVADWRRAGTLRGHDGIPALTVAPEQLTDSVLVVGRYRDPARQIDLDALRAEASELRSELFDSYHDLDAAMLDLDLAQGGPHR